MDKSVRYGDRRRLRDDIAVTHNGRELKREQEEEEKQQYINTHAICLLCKLIVFTSMQQILFMF